MVIGSIINALLNWVIVSKQFSKICIELCVLKWHKSQLLLNENLSIKSIRTSFIPLPNVTLFIEMLASSMAKLYAFTSLCT